MDIPLLHLLDLGLDRDVAVLGEIHLGEHRDVVGIEVERHRHDVVKLAGGHAEHPKLGVLRAAGEALGGQHGHVAADGQREIPDAAVRPQPADLAVEVPAVLKAVAEVRLLDRGEDQRVRRGRGLLPGDYL